MNNYFKSKIAKYIFPVAYCLLLIANCQLLIAQNTNPKIYSLEEAVKQALENNGTIKSANLQIEYQKQLKKTSWEFGNTTLDYSYGQSNSMVNDNNFTITQPLPNIGLSSGKSKLAEANIKNSQLDLTHTQAEIAGEVKSNYYELMYSIACLKLLKYQDSLYTLFYKAAALKADKGESSMLEKITAQTQLMKTKSRIDQANADIKICQNKLQQIMNEKEVVSIFESEKRKEELDVALDSTAVLNSPLAALYQQQVVISSMETKVEKRKYIPEIAIGYFNQSNKDLQANYRFTGIQAGISAPLLFFAPAANIKALKVNEQIMQTNSDYSKSLLQKEFQVLVQTYLKHKSNVEYYEKTALPQAELIIEQASRSYKGGDINYMEYVLNLDNAIEIKSNYLQAINEYNQSIIALEKMAGIIN